MSSHTKLHRDIFMNVTPRKKSCAYKNTPIPNSIDVTASAIKVLKGFYFFFHTKKKLIRHICDLILSKLLQTTPDRKLSRMQNGKREIRLRQSAGIFNISQRCGRPIRRRHSSNGHHFAFRKLSTRKKYNKKSENRIQNSPVIHARKLFTLQIVATHFSDIDRSRHAGHPFFENNPASGIYILLQRRLSSSTPRRMRNKL